MPATGTNPTCSPPLTPPAGATRLSQAQASARLNEQQQLSFNVEFVPAEGHRQSGYVRASGTVPLADADVAIATAGSRAGEPAQQQLDVRLSVKDSGMAILTSVTPDVHWQQGQATIDLRLRGSLMQPVLSGGASISKAMLDCPLLRFPLTNVGAEVRAREDLLTVESLEARCGRRGFARARGSLPMYAAAGSSSQHRLVAEASGLELRLRNMYSGQYDASLLVTSSLANPTVAGSMLFSKGIVFIVPQGGPGAPHRLLLLQALDSAGSSPAAISPNPCCCGCCPSQTWRAQRLVAATPCSPPAAVAALAANSRGQWPRCSTSSLAARAAWRSSLSRS